MAEVNLGDVIKRVALAGGVIGGTAVGTHLIEHRGSNSTALPTAVTAPSTQGLPPIEINVNIPPSLQGGSGQIKTTVIQPAGSQAVEVQPVTQPKPQVVDTSKPAPASQWNPTETPVGQPPAVVWNPTETPQGKPPEVQWNPTETPQGKPPAVVWNPTETQQPAPKAPVWNPTETSVPRP